MRKNNPWMPANGTEFNMFQDKFCFYCKNEDEDGYCSITDLALEQKQPKEWTCDDNFNPSCSNYIIDEEKEKRRNIAICEGCKSDINMLNETYKYLCVPAKDGMECSYYCMDCVNKLAEVHE